ncbi:MAG: 4Fe-4S binding protein [Actinobacteria bacterium]|nr:4Fe-4S binding protein [Actinomycetota bacterium]
MSDWLRPLKVLAKRKKPVWFIREAWDSMELFFRASRMPLVTRLHPWFRADRNDARWLPVNQDLELPDSVPLPITLLDRFIEESSKRVIVDTCPCRTIEGCKNYPVDIGCIFVGEATVEGLLPLVARQASIEEAKAHARRAVASGLVPVVGKVRLDNSLIRVRDRGKLLTICFCCECCCVTSFFEHMSLEDLDPIFPRLDGIKMEVTEECNGCGLCAKNCFIKAITVPFGKAQISDYCRACGRCATVCPKNAIKIRIEDPDYLEKSYQRIRQYVDHT